MRITPGKDASALDRRGMMLALAGALAVGAPASARAAGAGLAADDGSPIRSFAAPNRQRLLALPGVLAVGPGNADVTIAEFFDYNCGYCRQASLGLDEMLKRDGSLRILFVHNPILSAASMRAAEAIASTQTAYGVAAAYDLHRTLLEAPGRASDQSAFDHARAAGLDASKIEGGINADAVRDALRAQKSFADEHRLRFTPTFAIADLAFVGWPGVSTMSRFAAAVRRCGAVQCSSGGG